MKNKSDVVRNFAHKYKIPVTTAKYFLSMADWNIDEAKALAKMDTLELIYYLNEEIKQLRIGIFSASNDKELGIEIMHNCYICGRVLDPTVDIFYTVDKIDPTVQHPSEPNYICPKCYRVADFFAVMNVMNEKYPFADVAATIKIAEDIRRAARA